MDMDFDFLIFPRVEELDITGPYEVIGKVNDVSDNRCIMHILASSEITFCTHGLPLYRTQPLDQHRHGDVLVVPGGKGVRESSSELTAVVNHICSTYALYDLVLTICTGTFLLEKAGVLKEKTCTTHSRYQDLLRKKGYAVVPNRIVHHGDLITSTGVTSGIDASLYAVYLLYGDAVAQNIIERIEYPFSIDDIVNMTLVIPPDR
jgi:cyclohexyl-isocyanide hydratase